MDGEVEKDDLLVQDKDTSANTDQRLRVIREKDITDTKFGYQRYTETESINAWLVNVQPSEIFDGPTKTLLAACDFYFLGENGNRFKVAYPFRPYLYLGTVHGFEFQVAAYLTRKYPLAKVEHVEKENLDLKNHLSGIKSKFLFVSFPSTVEMAAFKKELFPQIRKNQERLKTSTDYTSMLAQHLGAFRADKEGEVFEYIIDIREYDLPYHMRVCIDEKIFVGLWYSVCGRNTATQLPSIKRNDDIIDPPEPIVCAFDIETTKLPLKFPDSAIDQVMMISYMIDGRGYLIINREIVSEDVDDFEYTPRPEFRGEFRVFNEKDEKGLLKKFFEHVLKVKPHIMVTYNGDFFDWPFVEARATFHGIDMTKEIGFAKDNQDEYKHINCIHMDAFRWVKRDSYLPVGSQNLKATTKAKLRYDPVELDPELMLEMAKHKPQTLASYSVSDAVSTYYLYMKYVHPFIFALCTIIPLGPDDVLRKGSGTLCEALLMVEAFHKSIIFPNKQIAETHKMTKDGHLLESETYVGGHVEALESGVFRADIPCKFRMDIDTLEQLKNEVKETLIHSLIHEMEIDITTLENLDEVVKEVQDKLDELINAPVRNEKPKIYHLDVGAMYPNIILTNRLQPPAVIQEEDCLACVYNTPDAKCKREMNWVWRGELIPAKRGEYERVMQQLEQERFGKPPKPFHSLPKEQRLAIEKKRVQDYCRKAYGKLHLTRIEEKTSLICERENGFYVNTVRTFRDRRYDYKAMLKKAKNDLSLIPSDDVSAVKSGQARVVLYESLQIAHKCILNSFYGYVMRKGSRWFSMEMAGIVCHTGANIITEARQLVERIGRPLELDTDGIWCLLPGSFPENYSIKTKSGKPVTISYPGAMLNAIVKDRFTNDQYHTLKDDGTYEVSSENSIFFEVDGPYLAMILPASKEEGKKLKKRYAVFNFDGTLAELKGFEVKRRGELNIIKEFQKDVFKAFLGGNDLQSAYESVAKVADSWLDVLHTKGGNLRTDELFDLIAENRSMSRKLEDYGTQKSTSITTAKRLAEFLGPDMVKNAGLACKFLISHYPPFTPVTERTIPLAIFQAEPKVTSHYLRKWTLCDKISPENINIRELIDWQYYLERLGSCIQKIVTIPAALQGISNPVPRVAHPDWLEKLKRQKIEMAAQPKISDIFKKVAPTTPKSTRSQTTTPLRKRPMPAIFEDDRRRENLDDEIMEIDGDRNPVKRKRVEEDSTIIPITPSRLTGWLKKKKDTVTPTQSSSTQIEQETTELPARKTWAKDGFNEWLTYMKKKWSRMRADRKAHKRNLLHSATKGSATPLAGRTRLDQMLASNRERIQSEFWHIIQINETKNPGVFDVFALVDGNMRRFMLNVPRIIYINDINERFPKNGRRVQKILPKMQACHNLYEYIIDESELASNISEFNKQLCAGNIIGIYETEIPLLFRAFVQMGATCRINSLANTYRLEQFERVLGSDVAYADLESFQTIFFYEYSQGSRTVFGLISPNTKEGYVFIVNKARIDLCNLTTFYATEFIKFVEKRGADYFPVDCEDIKMEAIQTTTIKDASKQISNTLKKIRINPAEPILLTLLCSRSPKDMLEMIPTMKDFPYVQIRVSEPSNLMNALDWGNQMVKRIVHHFMNSFTYLGDYLAIAHYAGIPVGNLPEDSLSLALDIMYARDLQQHNHILWASKNNRPDFGGKEADDLRIYADWDNVSFKQHHGRVINYERFEQKSCIAELEIGAVAVNALIQNVRIIEAEGSSESIGFVNSAANAAIDQLVAKGMRPTATITDFDEAASVSDALRVLRQVFHELIKEIHVNENACADQLVVHMYRWMCDPKSLMYNPAIVSSVNILMRKLCLLLVTEVNRMGGSVIYCSFSRLVLSTGNSESTRSRLFISSLIDSLSMKPIFAALQLVPLHLWNSCLWIDPTNFAAIGFREDEKENDEIVVDERIEMKFAMIEKLPEKCQKAFSQVVTGYMMLTATKIRESISDEELESFCQETLSNELSPRLFQITERLIKIRHILNSEYREANLVDGEEDHNFDVAVEFVKAICKALSLDKMISDPIENLRSQLIQMLSTNLPTSALEWHPPSSVCVLENLFCVFCNRCIDLDLCAHIFDDGTGFRCTHCNAEISKEIIEELLLERLSKMVTAFTLQDRRCVQCKQLAVRFLSRHCECSNRYELVIPKSEFLETLRTMKAISKKHELSNVEFAVQWQLNCFTL
uniref:DNA polymerase epsilon catalytic subunit n=1 Tax=Panagrolaimus sp. ES5 TaxID=591445 RepID=A0AC34GQD3_9BILA